MSYTRVQIQPFAEVGGQSVTGTMSSSYTAANTVVVKIGAYYGATFSETPFTIQDDAAGGSNVYNLKSSEDGGGSTQGIYDYVADNVKAASNITVSAAVNSGFIFSVTVIEYAGLMNPAYETSITNGTVATSPWNVGSITTTNASDLLIGGIFQNSTGATWGTPPWVADSPWINGNQNDSSPYSSLFIAEQAVSSAGSYSFSGTGGGPSTSRGNILALKIAGGTTYTLNMLSLLGAG